MRFLIFAAGAILVLGGTVQAADTYSGRPLKTPKKGYNMDAAVQVQ